MTRRLQTNDSCFEILKIWLTNENLRDRFFIMQMEIEMDKHRIDTGTWPDGVVFGKVKNLDLGMAIMHLFDRDS